MRYYSVITDRDYIKTPRGRIPFWNLMDTPPYGWLISLAYARGELPQEGTGFIYDCGAWTYRNQKIPTLFGEEVTPQWATKRYARIARQNSILIAPDHVVSNSIGDTEYRKEYNRKSAKEFIQICEDGIPMAVAHGLCANEKVECAHELYEMGYTHLGIGGLAGNARRKDMVISTVYAIRNALPNAYIHALGVSSEFYAKKWAEMRIDSFDGSSHFKKAFTAGYFYWIQNDTITHFVASKNKEGTVPVECNCRACLVCRQIGEDTRFYGNAQRNIGRAAHNLNVVLKYYRERLGVL